MKFESKFNIADLVQHKYKKKNPSKLNQETTTSLGYEVLEIIVQTCYGGTQIFYDVRSFHGCYAKDFTKDGINYKLMDIAHDIRRANEPMIRFREDELIEMDQSVKDFILGTPQEEA